MGKIRVKTLGDEEQEAKDKADAERKRAARLASAERSDGGQEKKAREDSEQSNETEDQPQTSAPEAQSPSSEIEAKAKPRKDKKAKFAKKANNRSANYKSKAMEVDKTRTYPLSEALELLKKINLAKFDETVELHINTVEAGINGTVKLPHGTGKELRIAVVNDEVLAEVESGKINFDILIAEPSSMPKLARVAKVLGPRGLMPNPKNGTISDNPQEAMKKFQGGQISFKTESKIPIIHVSVGKMSFGDEKLTENIQAFIGAVKKSRISKVVLKSTMSPAIKLAV